MQAKQMSLFEITTQTSVNVKTITYVAANDYADAETLFKEYTAANGTVGEVAAPIIDIKLKTTVIAEDISIVGGI